MTTREAAVKLTVDDGQFAAGMRRTGDLASKAVQKATDSVEFFGRKLDQAKNSLLNVGRTGLTTFERMGAAARKAVSGSVSAGASQAKKDLLGLGDVTKKAIGMAAGLAAGFSVAGAIGETAQLQQQYKQLAFRISRARGEAVSHTEIQRTAERAAALTGRKTKELAGAFDELFSATGDDRFAGDVLEAIGSTATATGAELSTLTTLADQLHTKFGVAADDMGDALAQVFDHAQKGGPSFSEIADVAANMGAELIEAGLGGKKGLDFMLGALVKTDDEMKDLGSQVKGVKAILSSLGDKKQIEAIAKALHLDPKKLLNEKDLLGRMRKVLGAKGGVDALKQSMGGPDEKKALRILFTDPFEAALKEANASGLKGKAAIDRALSVLDGQIAEFGKTTLSGADIQAQAAERMKDPAMQLQRAITTLEQSFSQPEIIEAINDLAGYLPELARLFGNFVKFAVQNPLLAGAMGIGGTAAKGFIQGAATEFIKAHWAGAVKGAAAIESAHVVGGMKAGNIMKGAAAAGAIVLAAALAKEQIDKSFDANTDAQKSTASALITGSSSKGNASKKRQQIADLKEAITKEKEAMSGASGFTQDLMGGLATLAGADAPNLRAQNESRVQELQGLLHKRELELAEMTERKGTTTVDGAPGAAPGKGGKAVTTIDDASARRVGEAVAVAMASGRPQRVEVVGKGGGSGGSRGPAQMPPAQPGGGF